MIPKTIIQTGPSTLPLIAKAGIASVRALNPTFQYLFFDDRMVDDFIDTAFPEYRPMFDSLHFRIQKFDLFRYLAVFHYGGFYFDLDVFFADSLDGVLANDCVFPFEELTFLEYFKKNLNMDWQIGNYGFGATAGNPFLEKLIENCIYAISHDSWVRPMMKGIPKLFRDQFYVLNTTGPGLVTRTLVENPEIAVHVEILFPEDVREPKTWHQFGELGIHNMTGSWRGKQGFVTAKLNRLWDRRCLRRIFLDAQGSERTRHLEGRNSLPNNEPSFS